MHKRKNFVVCLLFTMLCLLLAGCQTPRAPTWHVHATTREVLQAKQVNPPLSGTNYVLCQNCVHYSRLLPPPQKVAKGAVHHKKGLPHGKPVLTKTMEIKKHEKSCQ